MKWVDKIMGADVSDRKAPTGDPGMMAFVPGLKVADLIRGYGGVLDTRAEALERVLKRAVEVPGSSITDTWGEHFIINYPDGNSEGPYRYEVKDMTNKQKAHAAAVDRVENLGPRHVRHISERSNYYAVILNDGSVGGTHYFTEEKVMKTVTKEEALKEAVRRVEFLAGGGMGCVVLSECDGYWGVTPEHGVREKHEWTPPKPVFKEGTVGYCTNDAKPNVRFVCFIVKCKTGGYLVERLHEDFEGRQTWADNFTPLNKELNVNDAETIKILCVARDCSFAFKL